MKRVYIAAALIVLVFILSIFNSHYVENKTSELIKDIEIAEHLYKDGKTHIAASRVEDSLNTWLGWESYAHIMLRHTEIDLVTDAYFDLLSKLQSKEEVSEASFMKLKEQLNSISNMEKIKSGSIL